MYENPITRSTEDIMRTVVKIEEGYLIEAVHKAGFDINKEELAKALNGCLFRLHGKENV